MVKISRPHSISIQKAIQEAEREVERFANAESDPKLSSILLGRIDLSISNIADSIEKNYLEGSVIKQSDGSIDPLLSTTTPALLEYVRNSLEETKKNYISQHDSLNDATNILLINVHFIIAFFSIREEWDLWAIKQQLLADEAIPLMNGIDPGSWKEYQNKEKSLPYEMVHSIERCLKMAESDGSTVMTPIKWISWGRKHDLDKPILKSNDCQDMADVCMFILFESAVDAISEKSAHSRPTEKQTGDFWKEIALTKADTIYKDQKKLDCEPSKKAIADMIAKEFEREGTKSIKGKRLDGSYINRHALYNWKRPET